VFELRGKHPWPPAVRVYLRWPEGYRSLAHGMDFPVLDVAEAAAAVGAFVSRIASAPRRG
jgi:hypothetical protein